MKVIAPHTAEEAARLLAAASSERRHTLLVGAQTWLRGAEMAEHALSATQLRGAHAHPTDLTLEVAAGARLTEIQELLRPAGQWLAVDAPAHADATVGGLLATATAGPLSFGYGSIRGQVLGLDVVTGDGRLVRLGGRTVKNVAGYDLVRLLVGSRGTLGLITRAWLRVYALPEVDQTWVARDPDLRACEALRTSRAAPAALEWLGASTAEQLGLRREGTVLIRLHGSREAVEAAERHVAEAAGRAATQVDRGPAELWARLSELERRAAWVVRLTGLPTELPARVAAAEQLGALAAAHVVAHAGRGVVRVLGAGALDPVRSEIDRLKGVIDEPRLRRPPATGRVAELVTGLRRAFDPGGILSPVAP